VGPRAGLNVLEEREPSAPAMLHNIRVFCELLPLKPNKSYSFSLGKFASVFQTEIYAILLCAYKNIRRAHKNKQILIFSDSQAALKALSGPKMISRLVEECQEALTVLATLNEVTLIWCQSTVAYLETRWLTGLLDKHQLCHYLVQSRLLG
jgi:ADP-dependent phosphofructokinase/glucokinase